MQWRPSLPNRRKALSARSYCGRRRNPSLRGVESCTSPPASDASILNYSRLNDFANSLRRIGGNKASAECFYQSRARHSLGSSQAHGATRRAGLDRGAVRRPRSVAASGSHVAVRAGCKATAKRGKYNPGDRQFGKARLGAPGAANGRSPHHRDISHSERAAVDQAGCPGARENDFKGNERIRTDRTRRPAPAMPKAGNRREIEFRKKQEGEKT